MAYNYPWFDCILAEKSSGRRDDTSAKNSRKKQLDKLLQLLRRVFGKRWDERCVERLRRIDIQPCERGRCLPFEVKDRCDTLRMRCKALYIYVLLQVGRGQMSATDAFVQSLHRLFCAIVQTSSNSRELAIPVTEGINDLYEKVAKTYAEQLVQKEVGGEAIAVYDTIQFLEALEEEYTEYKDKYPTDILDLTEFTADAKGASSVMNRLLTKLDLEPNALEYHVFSHNTEDLNQMYETEYRFLSVIYDIAVGGYIPRNMYTWEEIPRDVCEKIVDALEDFSDSPAIMSYMTIDRTQVKSTVRKIQVQLLRPTSTEVEDILEKLRYMYNAMRTPDTIKELIKTDTLPQFERNIRKIWSELNDMDTEPVRDMPPDQQWSIPEQEENRGYFWLECILRESSFRPEADSGLTYTKLSPEKRQTVRNMVFSHIIDLLRGSYGELWAESCAERLAKAKLYSNNEDICKSSFPYRETIEYSLFDSYCNLLRRCAGTLRTFIQQYSQSSMEAVEEQYKQIDSICKDVMALSKNPIPQSQKALQSMEAYYMRAENIYPDLRIEPSKNENRDLFAFLDMNVSYPVEAYWQKPNITEELNDLVIPFREAKQNFAKRCDELWDAVCSRVSDDGSEHEYYYYMYGTEYSLMKKLVGVIGTLIEKKKPVVWDNVTEEKKGILKDIETLWDGYTIFAYMKMTLSKQDMWKKHWRFRADYPAFFHTAKSLIQIEDWIDQNLIIVSPDVEQSKLEFLIRRINYNYHCLKDTVENEVAEMGRDLAYYILADRLRKGVEEEKYAIGFI